MSKGTHRRRAHDAPDAAISHDDDHHGAGHRHGRLQQILREELAAVLRDEITDPSLDGVALTSVELSVDYKHARVRFVTPAGDRTRAERALARATPFFRARLADAVDLKQVPALRFAFDADAMRYGEEEVKES
jgi:ribosome-binding factor A